MQRIEWTPKALRQIRKIKDQKDREMIYNAVDGLQSFPKCLNVKKLKGCEEYRLRISRWRVLFRIYREILLIYEVKKRDEHTY